MVAHHGRLWNLHHRYRIAIPKTNDIRWITKTQPPSCDTVDYRNSTYVILAMLQCLLYSTYPENQSAVRLRNLIDEYEVAKVRTRDMGMPEDWYDDPFWEEALSKG